MSDMTPTVIDLAVYRNAHQEARQRQVEARRSTERLMLAEGLHAALCEAQHLSPSSRVTALLSAAVLELREDGEAWGDIAERSHELLRAVTTMLARKSDLAVTG